MSKHLIKEPTGYIIILISTSKTSKYLRLLVCFLVPLERLCIMAICTNCSSLASEVYRLSRLVENLESDYRRTEPPEDLFDFIERYPGLAEDFLEFITQEYKVEDRNSAEAVVWLQENHGKAYYYSKNTR